MSWQEIACLGIVAAAAAYLVRGLFSGKDAGCKACPRHAEKSAP